MNDDNDLGLSPATSAEHALLPVAKQPPRRRAGTLLTAAPALAITALATAPLAAAIRIAASYSAPDTAILADRCDDAMLVATTIATMKWPECAGD